MLIIIYPFFAISGSCSLKIELLIMIIVIIEDRPEQAASCQLASS